VYKTRHECMNLAGGQSFHFSVQLPSAEVGKEAMLPLFVACFANFPPPLLAFALVIDARSR